MEQPRYKHDDCEKCTFLGSYENSDLYFCSATPTVIARYGEHGDYISGLPFIKLYPVLALAAIRAIGLDLLTDKQVKAAISY